jgi:hypothetical protein
MKRVCHSVAASLDGYIADRDGGARATRYGVAMR